MEGWVKLHRCLLDKAVWQLNDAQRIVFFTILLLANHMGKQWLWKGTQFNAEPGQFVTSLPKLAKTARVSVQSVRTALENLKKLDFLTYQSTDTGRLITVNNWALYQRKENESTYQSTDNQQGINRVPTPTKNVKKVKKQEEDKNIYGEYQNVLLTVPEFEKLHTDFTCADEAIEFLSAWIEEKGYKSKSHNLAIRRWVIDAVMKKQPKQQSIKDFI